MIIYDFVWLCMTPYDFVRLCTNLHEFVWLFMTMFDNVWLNMTIRVWLQKYFWIIAIPKFDVPMYIKMESTSPNEFRGDLPRGVGP